MTSDKDKEFLINNVRVAHKAWNRLNDQQRSLQSQLRGGHDPDIEPELNRLEKQKISQANAYNETRKDLEEDYNTTFTEDGLPEEHAAKSTKRKHTLITSRNPDENTKTLQLQRDLVEMGLGEMLKYTSRDGKEHDGLDGKEGPKTRAALAAYAKANGLDEKTSRLDIVNHLRAAANECREGASHENAARQGKEIAENASRHANQREYNAHFNGQDTEQVKALQTKLRQAGYENVVVNGNLNDVHTGNAVIAFRHRHLGVDTNTLSDAEKTKVDETLLNKIDDVLDEKGKEAAKADPYKTNTENDAATIRDNAARYATEVKQALKDCGITIDVDKKVTLADEAKIKEWETAAKAAGKTVTIDGVLDDKELAALKAMAMECRGGEEVATHAAPSTTRNPQAARCGRSAEPPHI